MCLFMEKDDARFLTLEQLHERRKQVVRLHRNQTPVREILQNLAPCLVDVSSQWHPHIP